ncbi:hypothetical protein ACWCQ1_15485 [Streptomyces sp. NPDC002144]|uniref:hypothetical protein n=1 Tax=Streptomyces sp. NPDC006668 TaxID=3156903 RepID=UPI0033E6F3F8
MSNQQYPPQQPGWGGPQQPYGQPPFPPQPPKKTGVGRILGFGCLGIVGLVVVIGVVAAALGGGSGSENSGGSGHSKTTASVSTGGKPAGDTGTGSGQKTGDTKKTGSKVVTFKVWGTAPAGALGPLDISYGSDSDTRKGTFRNGEFKATLPLHKDAMYYTVTAQLQGSGDINCSVTVDGHTKKGHASGGYNICDAQLSSGFLGSWN